jgi:hypothetical protein
VYSTPGTVVKSKRKAVDWSARISRSTCHWGAVPGQISKDWAPHGGASAKDSKPWGTANRTNKEGRMAKESRPRIP